jgi:hypothetical protein
VLDRDQLLPILSRLRHKIHHTYRQSLCIFRAEKLKTRHPTV